MHRRLALPPSPPESGGGSDQGFPHHDRPLHEHGFEYDTTRGRSYSQPAPPSFTFASSSAPLAAEGGNRARVPTFLPIPFFTPGTQNDFTPGSTTITALTNDGPEQPQRHRAQPVRAHRSPSLPTPVSSTPPNLAVPRLSVPTLPTFAPITAHRSTDPPPPRCQPMPRNQEEVFVLHDRDLQAR